MVWSLFPTRDEPERCIFVILILMLEVDPAYFKGADIAAREVLVVFYRCEQSRSERGWLLGSALELSS